MKKLFFYNSEILFFTFQIDSPSFTIRQPSSADRSAGRRHLETSAGRATRAEAARPHREQQLVAAGGRTQRHRRRQEDSEGEEDEREEARAESRQNVERHLVRFHRHLDAVQRSRRLERDAGQEVCGHLHPGHLVAVFLLPLLHQFDHQPRVVRALQRFLQTNVRSNPDLQVEIAHQTAFQPILLRIIDKKFRKILFDKQLCKRVDFSD